MTGELRERVEALSEAGAERDTVLETLAEVRAALNAGIARVAEKTEEGWVVNQWVKTAILLHAQYGRLRDASLSDIGTHFDYDTLPLRRFKPREAVRIGQGAVIRDGAYFAERVSVLPGSTVNIGAWIDEGSAIDSHVSIGVGCQIGKHVQISCGTQIGGVIHPLPALPAIIQDNVVIGGNCGIYDSVHIGEGAVIAAGTIISGYSRVYDFRRKALFRAEQGSPLMIPPLAVVLPGARLLTEGAAEGSGLMLSVPIIVGRRDEVNLEGLLLDELMS